LSEQPPAPIVPHRSPARIVVLAAAIAQALFLLYTWWYVPAHANPKGDGMELVALVPLTIIFLVFVLPALTMGIGGRGLRVAVVLLLIGGIANFLLWTEILSEFASHGR
jgi:hypothetical protein